MPKFHPMSLTTNANENLPLTGEDRACLQSLLSNAWLKLARTYAIFFLGLPLVYITMKPGPAGTTTFRGRSVKIPLSEFQQVFPFFAVFFGAVFLFYFLRDFRRKVLPFYREMRLGNKSCTGFFARKYQDPIFSNYLLFYPGKEDVYISLSQEEFDQIANGQHLYLETACVTGEVLALKSGEKKFLSAAEFVYE
jgi:hypothetical protein